MWMLRPQRMAAMRVATAAFEGPAQIRLWAVVAEAPTGSAQFWAKLKFTLATEIVDIAPGVFGWTVAAAVELTQR